MNSSYAKLTTREIVPCTAVDELREGRQIIQQEADALQQLARKLDTRFCDALECIRNSQGSVIVSGLGKAGLIGQKITATFSSTGTRSYFLHPTEAVHGDLGCVTQQDVALLLSNSGETDEVVRLVPILQQLGLTVIAMTANAQSSLGKLAHIVLELGKYAEAGSLGLAPSTSTTVMLALGDALALVLCRSRGFTKQHFAILHPSGNLGKQLRTVQDVMRKKETIRVAYDSQPVRDVFVTLSCPGRRTGAVLLTNAQGQLTGIFTDSDLARLLEHRRDQQFDLPICDVMTRNPVTVQADMFLQDAVDIISQKHLSELPVINEHQEVLGLLDITDVIGLLPPTELS